MGRCVFILGIDIKYGQYVIVISLQNGVYQPYMPEAEPRACMS